MIQPLRDKLERVDKEIEECSHFDSWTLHNLEVERDAILFTLKQAEKAELARLKKSYE